MYKLENRTIMRFRKSSDVDPDLYLIYPDSQNYMNPDSVPNPDPVQ